MNPLGGVRYGAEIFAAARAHGLDPALLAAVAAQETGGPGATSGRNVVGDGGHGRGVFQIDDRSWAFARTPAAMDPGRNAAMAAQILADDLRAYHGDVHASVGLQHGTPRRDGHADDLGRWTDARICGLGPATRGGLGRGTRPSASMGCPFVGSRGRRCNGIRSARYRGSAALGSGRTTAVADRVRHDGAWFRRLYAIALVGHARASRGRCRQRRRRRPRRPLGSGRRVRRRLSRLILLHHRQETVHG